MPEHPTDRAALRDRIAQALWPLTDWDGDQLNAERAADAVLAVLPPVAPCSCHHNPALTAGIGYPVRCPHCPLGTAIPPTDWVEHVQRHHPEVPPAVPQDADHVEVRAAARDEGAIDALRTAAEHMRVGVAIGPIPPEVRPAVEKWLCRLAEQRLDRARRTAADRLHAELATARPDDTTGA